VLLHHAHGLSVLRSSAAYPGLLRISFCCCNILLLLLQHSAAAAATAAAAHSSFCCCCQVLEVIEMGRTFQSALSQLTAPNNSSSSCSSSSTTTNAITSTTSEPHQQQQQQHYLAALTAVGIIKAALAAAASQAAEESASGSNGLQEGEPGGSAAQHSAAAIHSLRLLELRAFQTLRGCPNQFFQHAFEFLGQLQVNPLHLLDPQSIFLQQQQQQQGHEQQQQEQGHQNSASSSQQRQQQAADVVAAIDLALQAAPERIRDAAAAAARRAAECCSGNVEDITTPGQQWTEAIGYAFRHCITQQMLAGSGSSSSSGSSWDDAGSSSRSSGDGDQVLLQLCSKPEGWELFTAIVHPLLFWQHGWASAAAPLVAAAEARDADAVHLKCLRHRSYFKERDKAEQAAKHSSSSSSTQEQQGKGKGAQKKQGRGEEEQQQQQQQKEEDEARDAADFQELLQHMRCCELCMAEQAAAPALNAFGSSSSSSSELSSSAAAAAAGGEAGGLYGNLPVPWSDPCLMRRLLWELLGKLKPAAQQWFKYHGHVCPHRRDVKIWQFVVMSLARHIWSPPGTWDAAYEQQYNDELALLLPLNGREPKQNLPQKSRLEEETAARSGYAKALNVGFARQGSNAQTAAVLSLQVLLSLDPHGARVQPKPELLFYTPAGFHAAVCKTLMQALQINPWGAPVAAAQGQLGCVANSSSGSGSGGRFIGPLEAAGSGQGTCHTNGISLTQQQQQQQQQQQELVPDRQQQPHPLQAWSCAAFPAWYVWWHIGLLAYHQQQQQQQHGGVVRAGSGGSSSSNRTGSGSAAAGSSGSSAVCLQDLYSSVEAR
jgi:hypothetical protein